MKLPPPGVDREYVFARQHDLDEIWEPARQPHVACSHAARFGLLRALVADYAPAPARILDIGCAQGTLGLQLAEQGYRVTLLDVRPAHIEYARARYERGDVRFEVGQLAADCPADGDYDVVSCTEVLEHVPRPAHLLGELAQKARRGGIVLLTTPNADYALSRLPSFAGAAQDVIDQAEPDSRDGDSHRYLFTRDELVALARGAGLRLIASGYFLPFWVEGHLKTRFLHRAFFRCVRRPAVLSAALPANGLGAARFLCAAQYLVAQRPES